MTEFLYLAEANGDPMISGNWIIAVIGAVASAGALLIGKMQGRKEATDMTLRDPVPTVPTSKVYHPPSWDMHQALTHRVIKLEDGMTRMQDELQSIRKESGLQYVSLLQAGSDRELRIGEKLDAVASEIHRRIDKVLKSDA
jgi:hypothetical protein